jgi:hypothetical protein
MHKSRKAPISVVMSVCPQVVAQLHWTGFGEVLF